jgi:signal transduction histidine kinase
MHFSIRAKTIILFSLLTILLTALTARLSYVFIKNIYMEQLKDQVHVLCSAASNNIDPRFLEFIMPENESLAKNHYHQALIKQSEQLNLNEVFIFDTSGTVLVESSKGNAAAAYLINQQLLKSLPVSQTLLSVPFKAKDGRWYLWGFHRLNKGYYLGLQESVQRLAEIDYLTRLFWTIGLAGVLITILTGWFLARNLAAPIEQLADFSLDIGKGNFNSDIPEKIYGELAVLKDSLIKMRADLQKQQEEKENILAQIAHELRNPLGGIELLASLIKEKPEAEEKNTEYLEKMLSEIQFMKGQLNAFLEYSRPVPASTEDVNLEDLAHELENSFSEKLKRKAISLYSNLNIETVKFDKAHLKQVLVNLLENSINIIEKDGYIEILADSQNQRYFICITDNGPGVPEENLENIFKPFFSGRKNGTGLGLSICRKLCEENNAEINAVNNDGQGCTFRIEIKRT